mgnify:FL=1|tara:strand:- start:79 stop:339 length:261 start_codon:yes stop_codon:yes gene_type:complete
MITNKPTMPVSGYAVFIYNQDIGAFAPQFRTMDEAEEFANAMRLKTDLTVSEPYPIIATHTNKEAMEIARGVYGKGLRCEDGMGST